MNFIALIYLLLVSLIGIILIFSLPLVKIMAFLVGPAVGIILVTTFTLLSSWLFGFTVSIIWYSVFLTLIACLVWQKFCSARKPSFKFTRTAITVYLKRHWPLGIIFLTIGGYSVYIFLTQVLTPYGGNLMTGGGGLYGDTALHSAYTTSLAEQGLPPQNPLFAGQVLIYPFLVDFSSAILVKLGLSLRWAFVLPQIIYLIAFLTMFYIMAKRFTNNLGTFLSLLIFFLGWGLGFIPYLTQVFQSGNWAVSEDFTNNMRDFQLHNVLTGLIFPERSFLPGLVIGLLITNLILFTDKFRSRLVLIIIGIFLGILPWWHTHTFIFFGVSTGLWLLFDLLEKLQIYHPYQSRSNPKQLYHCIQNIIYQIFPLYLTALLLALPSLAWFAKTLAHNRFLHWSFGWITSADNQLLFWFKNTGLLIPLLIFGWVKMPQTFRKYFIPSFVMFFVSNLIIFQPWDWDNIKLFSWVFLFLVIPAGFILEKLFSSKFFLIKLISLIFLISLTASGTLSLIKQTQSRFTIYDKADQELVKWIKTNTKPTDVFLIDPWPNHPLPGLSGRSVYLGYPGHLWVHGIDYFKRENQVKKILAGDMKMLKELDIPIDYIVTLTDSLLNSSLPQNFRNSKFSVLRITPP